MAATRDAGKGSVQNGEELKARILVVDGAPPVLQATAQALRSAGFEALEAADAETGLRVTRQVKPDLVLLGRNVLALDGLELCRRIKGDPALEHTLVVFLAAEQNSRDEETTGLDAGADAYIAYPVSSRELLARVEAMLRIKRANDARWESERNFLRTFDQAPIGAAMVATDFRYLRVNARFCEITGYCEPEPLRFGFGDITHPDDVDADTRQAQRLLPARSTNTR